jgi:ABC-2 type transport system permease protein
MTATTSTTSDRAPLFWVISDGWEMTRRRLVQLLRNPFMIVFSAMQPIIFAFLFRYSLSGALEPFTVTGRYVDFLMPGVFAMAMAFGAMSTASGLAGDLDTAAIDRFRSLPMARSAMLIGHTTAEVLRSALILTLVVLMGFLMGFEIHTNWFAFLVGLGLMLAFSYALIWTLALVGVIASNVQTAEGAVFQVLFPLTFVSSAFVPTHVMSDWLRFFADHQPVTAVVDASRALMYGGPTTDPVLTALAWIAGMLIVFPLRSRSTTTGAALRSYWHTRPSVAAATFSHVPSARPGRFRNLKASSDDKAATRIPWLSLHRCRKCPAQGSNLRTTRTAHGSQPASITRVARAFVGFPWDLLLEPTSARGVARRRKYLLPAVSSRGR